MEIGTTVIGIIITLICALPIILSAINRHKKKKKKLSVIPNIEEANGCKIGSFDYCGHFLLGIDSSNSLVFCVNWVDNDENIQRVNLSEIQSCQIINSTRKNGGYSVVERVELLLKHKDKNQREVKFELYSMVRDGANLSDELKIAEKWCEVIARHIS